MTALDDGVSGVAPKALSAMTPDEYRLYVAAYNRALGSNLRAARKELKLSQLQLAEIAGMARVTLSKIERACQAVTPQSLACLAAALGVVPSALLPALPEATPAGPPR